MTSSNKNSVIRVLHVDDDSSVREITKLMLMDFNSGFEIDQACCVDEAFKKLTTKQYDVVVSDYEMPQKNGLQFLKELRKEKSDVPFILFTGKGREEVAINALNLGADGYFNKQGTPETVYGELSHGIRQSVERKKAKDALRVSEENFRAYLESSPVSVFVANQEGKYEYVNAAASRLLAYSRQELLNMTVSQVGPKRDTPKTRFAQLKEKGYFAEEMKLEQKNGKSIDVFLSSTKLPDGKLIAFCEDISERKVAEEKLKGTNAILDRIGESIDGGLAVIGKDYQVVWANKRLMDLGVAPNKKCYQTFNTSKTICSDCGAKKIFEQNVTLDVHEYKTVNSKGETIWVELRVTPLKDKQGNVTAALELAVPITERKKADQKDREEAVLRNTLLDNIPCTALVLEKKTRKIVASNKIAQESGAVPGEICYKICANRTVPCTFCLAPKLWATNETQTLEVEYEDKHYRGIWLPYNEDLYVHYIFDITEAKNVEKTLKKSLHQMEILTEKLRVVGGLTRHDVGNKLAAIGANEFLLRKRIKDKPEFIQYLDSIKTAITSSGELFEFSRIYEQIGVEELEKMDVFECFNSAVALFSNLNGVKVVNECQRLQVIADSLLIQLFYNLIDNSLKHGKKVTKIRLYSKIDGGLEKIVYEDNGVGVSEVNKLRLFEVGFTTGNGSGFGLPLIKRMIEVYGWTIIEEGEPGKGAKFVISIPNPLVRD